MDDRVAWDFYFSTLVGWSMHPGYNRPDTVRPKMAEMAEMADQMLKYRPK